ncbi:DUF4932 domain-containing protein [Paraflavitalea soli]|nr:DUF4932 domain-containing protein [Paraflavitalea soli]
MRFILIPLLTVILLASCATTTRNWKSNDQPGQFAASFGLFSGKEKHTVNLTKDDILFIKYTLIATSGEITLSVSNKGGVVWQKKVTGTSDTSEHHLVAPSTGQYTITVNGQKATGGFEVKYKAVPPKTVQVKTHRNIELYGLMMVLDDGPYVLTQKDTMDYSGRRAVMAQWYSMVPRNYERYKAFDTCRIMSIYKKMETAGNGYDFFTGFLLQVGEVPFARISATTDLQQIARFSPKGDTAEARQKATAFLDALNDFSRLIDLDAHLAQYKPYYELAIASVAKNVPRGDFLPVMEQYYRKQFSEYNLVPSLNLFTAMGFGTMNRSTRTIYNTFGSFTFQSFDSKHPDMGFDDPVQIRALAAHEFGHSFTNPAIDSLPPSLIKETAYLYEPIKEEMKKHGYTIWLQSLYEHLVRAGEVIVAEKIGDSTRAVSMLQSNIKSGFIYLPFMVQELKKWDKSNSSVDFNNEVLQMIVKLKEAYKPAKMN